MDPNIFRESSLQKITRQDQDNLTDYIKTITVKAWVSLSAVLILLVCMLIWVFTTTLTDKIHVIGLSDGNQIICYLSPETCRYITYDTNVKVNGINDAKILKISTMPYSRNEVENTLKFDYIKSNLSLSDWNIAITISCTDQQVENGKLYDVTITKGKVSLVQFFIN